MGCRVAGVLVCAFITGAGILASAVRGDAAIPAFPGAEGFGAQTPGGRSGRVLEVTNLDADGPGSLKAALNTKGPRIVVFRVSGVIELKSGLIIQQPFVTIAGQTAPGDGICLHGAGLKISTHDVIVRYLRVRVGDHPAGPYPEDRDAIGISGTGDRVYNIVLDHCSASWAIDENIQTWYGPRDLTIGWCITSESLHDSLHPRGPHGKGMILGSQDNTITVHHCLFAHNDDRNPLMGDTGHGTGASVFDFRNNLIYNHGPVVCGMVRGQSRVNLVGNTIKMGPDGIRDEPRGLWVDWEEGQRFYVHDNVWPGQHGVSDDPLKILQFLGDATDRKRAISDEPIEVPAVSTQSAEDAYETVLNSAGAILPLRDLVDARIVEDVRRGTGRIIHTPAQVRGLPLYQSKAPLPDSDHDGMPDTWETERGFRPDAPADGPADADGDGYTNIEEYLNGTDPRAKTQGSPLPSGLPRVQKRHRRPVGLEATAPVRKRTAREFAARVAAAGEDVADYLRLDLVDIKPGEFSKQPTYQGEIRVVLTKPFEMSAFEITQRQWVTVMGTRPWRNRPFAQDSPEHPATYIDWADCLEFLVRMNACGHGIYRLPTEAEWEYACRAGNVSASGFGFDKSTISEFAWYHGNTVNAGKPYAHAVGQKRPNAWGLFDMAGNVMEWCSDASEGTYWSEEKRGAVCTEPRGGKGKMRIVRGGSFYYDSRGIFEYPAREHRPGYANFDTGFRVVREKQTEREKVQELSP